MNTYRVWIISGLFAANIAAETPYQAAQKYIGELEGVPHGKTVNVLDFKTDKIYKFNVHQTFWLEFRGVE